MIYIYEYIWGFLNPQRFKYFKGNGYQKDMSFCPINIYFDILSWTKPFSERR